MVNAAADAIKEVNPKMPCVLGGISPIDPNFIKRLERQGVLDHVDIIAVHGFPLDWNHWTIHEWPDKLEEIRAVTKLPMWISEVGVSTFGAEEVQEFGVQRTAELLKGTVGSDALVQPLRSSARLAGHNPPSRGRGIFLLPPFLHGSAPRRRQSKARV